MFTDNEFRRIRAFQNERGRLTMKILTLQNRIWRQTHIRPNQAGANQSRTQHRIAMRNIEKLHQKELQYANALKRKYNLKRIYSGTEPNLNNIIKAMKLETKRRVVEKIIPPLKLTQNINRTIARKAYPSPPRKHMYNFPTGQYLEVEPW